MHVHTQIGSPNNDTIRSSQLYSDIFHFKIENFYNKDRIFSKYFYCSNCSKCRYYFYEQKFLFLLL